MAELLFSAALPVLFQTLTSDFEKFLRQEGLYSNIKKLEKKSLMIQAVLDDAEEKQLKSNAVRVWLDELRVLAYDAEDILDEFATELLARKLEIEQRDQASTSKVRRFIPASFGNLSLKAIKFHIRMRSKIQRVTSELEQLHQQRVGLGLQESISGGTSAAAYQRPLTTSIPTEPVVVGRDDDKAKILEMVFMDDPNTVTNFHVISIVGMGGIGKSTLAREVYNDKAVQESFELRVWACVSNDFDVLRISKVILESITRKPCDLKDLNVVQVKLQEEVATKKFLLVLDDVWSKNYNLWETLMSPFKNGASGSKIILTTRQEDVALTMARCTQCYKLEFLSDDECWSLFQAHAFQNDVIPNKELIRQKVIEKSKGLPLASRTLGGLLGSTNIACWLHILNSKLWDLKDGSDEIPTTLKLSYYYLPPHLKSCFAHCAILLEDYEFQEEELVHHWIAEDLIQPLERETQLEDVGHEYFKDLLSRSFFQQSNSDESTYIMHDLVNELAKWASRGTCSHLKDMSGANKQLGSFKKVRHLSYASDLYDGKHKFEVISKVEREDQCLRTFLPLITKDKSSRRYITNTVISDLLPKFKRLRMLSLEDYYITELPEWLGDLKHLRYLNLSGTRIKSLSESTTCLLNLKILKLRSCYYLRKLPSNMRNLINLRYLDIRDVDLDEMPVGMEELKCLQYLSDFTVGKDLGASLKELKNLKFLRGELRISNLVNVVDLHDTREMILNDKDLKTLHLKWHWRWDNTRNVAMEKDVLNLLQPHFNIENLTILYYGGVNFPSWVGGSSPFKITVLKLECCQRCTLLPSLGLLIFLKDLTITWMKSLKRVGKEIYGQGSLVPFQSLETLCFEDLPEWEHWDTVLENEYGGAFPRLRNLSIVRCPKLAGILVDRPSLDKLVIKNCEQLVVSFLSTPKLCELKIDGCKRIKCDNPVDFKSMKSLSLSNISELSYELMLECFGKAQLQQINDSEICLEKPPEGGLQSITFLIELFIANCSNLVSFPEVCSLPHLRKLEIECCNALSSLPEGMNRKNACLESLRISKCESLAFILEGQLPSSLKELEISECEKLERLWDNREGSCRSTRGGENDNNVNSSLQLESLCVSECPSLTCLSSISQLPATLKSLELKKCPQLAITAEGFYNNMSLEVISIKDCENLQIPTGLRNLRLLQDMYIGGCPSIESFPEEGLADTNLWYLTIQNCKKLKALPNGLRSLNSLEYLTISECPRITSYNPEEDFPTNLKTLEIDECVNVYRPLVEWGLHNLTSLTTLWIDGCPDVESFPQQEMGMMLPPSLTDLKIKRCRNLKHLWSQGSQNLTSLQYLTICSCPNLTSLADQGLPSSLQHLLISNCKKLTCFPKQGLPSSLQTLHIQCCPKLKKECKRNKGREWSKISNILKVQIDDDDTHELKEDEEPWSRLTNWHPMHCYNFCNKFKAEGMGENSEDDISD